MTSKTKLNQIANGTCPKCSGPLSEIDMDFTFESVAVKLECENCLSDFRAHFDIIDWEEIP